MKLTELTARVLESATFNTDALTLNEQLNRREYTHVNAVIEALGGKWSRQRKQHVFETDPSPLIQDALETGEVLDAKRELQQFFTPPALAGALIDRADIEPGMICLEPSFGEGAFLRPMIQIAGEGNTFGVEVHGAMVMRAQEQFPDAMLWAGDFMKWPDLPPEKRVRFDRIVMNPPFTRQQDIDHVSRAIDMLLPGGRLIAIMSGGVKFRTNSKTTRFIESLGKGKFVIDDLPAGSFKASGTDVHTVLLTYAANA